MSTDKNYLNRISDYYKKTGVKHFFVENMLWREYQKMLIPVGKMTDDLFVSKNGAKQLFSEFNNAILCRNVRPLVQSDDNPPFYSVVCKNFIHIDDIPSNKKRKIKKGLKNCEVRPLDNDNYADDVYNVYVKALEGYGHKPQSREVVLKDFFLQKDYYDIINYWGVFVDNKLAGYSKMMIFDNKEAAYIVIKFDPEYLKDNISFALFYKLNEHYLSKEKFDLTSNGYKTLLHKSNVQSFLIQNLGFEKYAMETELIFKPFYKPILKTLLPFKKLVGKVDARVEALLKLVELEKECRKKNVG